MGPSRSIRAVAAILVACFIACQSGICSAHLGSGMLDKLFPSLMRHKQENFQDVDDDTIKQHWALLIAGSNGWWNYRHQADVLHSYQVLRNGGLHPDNIVVMVYDDIASDTNNPTPGKVFNRPGGPNVYHGVKIDYRGDAVNSETFLAVLEGNKTAVKGKGSGKVIASGPRDRVFVFYSDHGSPGVLGMPSGDLLYADQLIQSIKRKHAHKGYKEMILYVEACESGSMFEGLLPSNLGVYVTTAANAQESSWGTYCPGMDVPSSPGMIDTCLGDLYSVAWMEDAECADTSLETLLAQFELVKARASNNFTYSMGSHVMKYGQVGMQAEHTGSYMGVPGTSACMRPESGFLSKMCIGRTCIPKHRPPTHQMANRAVPQREADLVPLHVAVARATTPAAKAKAQGKLDAEVRRRQAVDVSLLRATEFLLSPASHVSAPLKGSLLRAGAQQAVEQHPANPTITGGEGAGQQLALRLHAEQLMGVPVDRAPGQAVVNDWECLRRMVGVYTAACGPMDQYAMKHTRLFANLCNAGVSAEALSQALLSAGGCAQHIQPAVITAAA